MEVFKTMQMGLAYSQSLLSYKTDGMPRPFSASFVVSNRCNIRCSYCNFPLLKEPELSTGQIDTILARLRDMGVQRLGLLGGEPLYRKDIIDLIGSAKEKGFFLSLNSNLLMYDRYKDQLGAIDYYFTSLDGTPERHIKNRGKQDLSKVMDAIRHIRSAHKKLTAICVVTDYDLRDAEYLIALAKDMDINLHFQPECYDTEIVLRSAGDQFDQEKARAYWRYILRQKEAGAPVSSSHAYLEYLIRWEDYTRSSMYIEDSKCAAGRGYIFVDATGHAYPCAYTKGKMKGVNLLEQDWRQAFDKKTPCTKCIVGPMLEFNLLFDKPLGAIANVLKHA